MTSSPDPMIGAVFAGRYQLVACLGSGPLGVVFEARDLDTGGSCAVKTLHDGAREASDLITSWVRDRSAARQLVHPHIAHCRDVSLTDDGSPYVAMNLLDGAPLAAYLKTGLAYDAGHALPIAKAALSAIREAHDRGLVHGDLKPTNLFMVRKEEAPPTLQVLDFGCARAIEMRRNAAERVAEMDLRYLSPEQQAGAHATFADDLWVLGVVLFELLTGHDPFAGTLVRDSGTRRSATQSFQTYLAAPHLQHWCGFFAKAFAAAPTQRFHAAADMLHELAITEGAAQSVRGAAPAASITDLSPAMAAFAARGPMAPHVELLGSPHDQRSERGERLMLETTLPGASAELVPTKKPRTHWKFVLLVAAVAVVAFAAGYLAGHI